VLSFGGHATAAAAALKNIEIIERERLVENAAEMGAYLFEGLNDLRKLPIVGDVRGRGLLAAVELVRDKQTREPFAPKDMMASRITSRMRDEGVLMRTFQVAEFGPPLNAGRAEIERIVETLERTIVWFMKETGVA
ncbi:MAG TPA: aminotransferase class III-fold pyridoxal phosphate-dependent enzyme, partial [Afipia sp.]